MSLALDIHHHGKDDITPLHFVSEKRWKYFVRLDRAMRKMVDDLNNQVSEPRTLALELIEALKGFENETLTLLEPNEDLSAD